MRRNVHPERFASFGERSVIVPPAIILNPHRIHIGDRVLLHDRTWLSVVEEYRGQRFEPTLTIGDRTTLGRDTYISCVGRIEIANDVLGGDRVLIADSYHMYEDPDRPISEQPMAEPRPVKIEEGVLLNVNVNILPGVTIGARSYIGAGAVVTRSVPPNSVVVGNPARILRHYDHEQQRWVDGAPAGWED
jgi:acetyltransferase-like isoleucine patch superfamily enzyme